MRCYIDKQELSCNKQIEPNSDHKVNSNEILQDQNAIQETENSCSDINKRVNTDHIPQRLPFYRLPSMYNDCTYFA